MHMRKTGGASNVDRWIRCLQPNPNAKLRLICFPFAGGGANFYRRWPAFFPKTVEVHAIQLPGRETRLHEPCVKSADAVANAVLEEMRSICWRQPVAFFGHSMGSMLAYDVATKLRAYHGWEPDLLFVSGRQAPHLLHGGDFHRQPDDVFITEIKRLGGTPEGVLEDHEIQKIFLPILRSDYAILETYRASASDALTRPIVTCVGDNDSEAAPEQMKNWQQLTRGPCFGRTFSGDHFYLKDRLPELAAFMNECMLRFPVASSTLGHSDRQS